MYIYKIVSYEWSKSIPPEKRLARLTSNSIEVVSISSGATNHTSELTARFLSHLLIRISGRVERGSSGRIEVTLAAVAVVAVVADHSGLVAAVITLAPPLRSVVALVFVFVIVLVLFTARLMVLMRSSMIAWPLSQVVVIHHWLFVD